MKTQNKTKGMACGNAAAIERYRDEFLGQLEKDDYCVTMLRGYRRSITCFSSELLNYWDEDIHKHSAVVMRARKEAVQKLSEYDRKSAHYRFERFLAFLIERRFFKGSVLPKVIVKPLTSREILLRDYENHLRNQRGLSESSLSGHRCHLLRFLEFRFEKGPDDLKAISPKDLVRFIRYCQGPERKTLLKTHSTKTRTFLRYLFWSEQTEVDMSKSIPRIASPVASALPKHLSQESVQELLNSVRTEDATGQRNFAMLLLMARLGLRATEVVAIRLEDVDWRAGDVLIRGKGQYLDRMPLSEELGNALVKYAKNGRKGSSRFFFVSLRWPHGPLEGGFVLNHILQTAYEKTGIQSPQKRIGSHVFRHSLAMSLLEKGASLEEVGRVLRHRSRLTTTVYAKHDLNALSSIVREWPSEGGAK